MSMLASVLIDRDMAATIRAMIYRDDLYDLSHQVIWDVACRMIDAKVPLDPVLLSHELRKTGQLDEIGGMKYLGEIVGSVPSAAHGEHYAKIVKDAANARRIIQAADKALRWAYSPERREDPAAKAMELAGELADIGANHVSDGFRHVTQILESEFQEMAAGRKRRVPTGWADLDNVIGGLPRGGMTLVAGRPGMGKSAVLKTLARSYSLRASVAVITVEESSAKAALNIAACVSGVDNRNVANNELSPNEWARLWDAYRVLQPARLMINDRPTKISDVESAVSLAKIKHGADVIIVDYLQLIDDELGADNENRQVTEVSRRLKNAFKRHDVVGIVAAQLNRGGQLRQQIPPPPTLTDLRGSGALEQDGDVIIGLHSEDYYMRGKKDYLPTRRIELHGLKNKDGPTFTVPLYYEMRTLTIRDRTPAEVADDDNIGGANGFE
jgi:replicative DNA helicase